MRPLFAALSVQLLVGLLLVSLVATGNVPFVHDALSGGEPVIARVGSFDGPAAFSWLRRQVAYGPRPAGSPASRRLAERLRRALPRGRFQPVPGGLRNVVGTVPGRDPRRLVVVGAHYDTKDIPGFVGANDGASGTAAVIELAHGLRPGTIGPTVAFVLFDGEEAPAGVPDSDFERRGDRGSKVAARVYRRATAMILLDFVANRHLVVPREASSDRGLWSRLRASARRAHIGKYFPEGTAGAISDDHTPFLREGVPSINLIDFDFPCFHRLCDNLSAVSEASLDVSGEAVYRLLRTL